MKKWIILVLLIVCVLGVIVFNSFLPKKQSVSNNVTYTDVEEISVQVDGMCTYPEMTTLIVSWNNRTKYTITYGDMYWIERLENGEWVDCSLKENVFTLIGYLLKPNEKIEKEYRLTDMYDVSIPGTYRFRSTCRVGVGNEKECSVWAEFVIE